MSIAFTTDDGGIVLFYRGDSPALYARVKLSDGQWLQRSTKTQDKHKALETARRLRDEALMRERYGLASKTTTFAHVCRIYLRDIEEEVKLGLRHERHLTDYKPVVETYLRPYFGKRAIDEIKNQHIAEYQRWRAAYWISGPGASEEFVEYRRNGKLIKRPRSLRRPPSTSTLATENAVLRGIFKTAVRYDFMREAQVPTITQRKTDRTKTKQRAAFNIEEYDALCQFLFEWSRDPRAKNPERRWLLRSYVLFLIHSGLRPGTETDGLRWKHLREIEAASGDKRYVVTVEGKTGSRYPVVSGVGFGSIKQIQIDLKLKGIDVSPEMPVFCLPNGEQVRNNAFRQLFRRALEKAGMLMNNRGERRCLYSLRHTYATFQLVHARVSVYTLAKQMGTSVKMIEQHYGHLTPELAIEELTQTTVDDVIAKTQIKPSLP